MPGPLAYMQWTIANGATASTNELDLREYEIVGLQIATITGATFSFTARASDRPDYNLTSVAVVDNAGAAVSITATDDRYIVLTDAMRVALQGMAFAKIVSAGAEGAARTVHVVARRALS